MKAHEIDIEKMAAAIEADAGQKLPGLKTSLKEMKQGQVARTTTPDQLLVRQARKAVGYTQPKFAIAIKTPVGTLRDWEQGRFEPSGAAIALMSVIKNHPDIIHEL